MSNNPKSFDIIVLGAGPAGLCAAIRLLDLGYSVGMLEQEAFPRPQIGESLSPGIYNIFEYLNAAHLIENFIYLKNISVKVIWENKEQTYHRSGEKGGGIIVERSKLDADLLQFAVAKGLIIMQPSRLKHFSHIENGWLLNVLVDKVEIAISSKVVLDARGRKGTLLKERIHTAPTAIALWTNFDNQFQLNDSQIEAVKDGWIWGSPVSGNRYRIMAFTDPNLLKSSSTYILLVNLINHSKLFSSLKDKIKENDIETCSVTSYVNHAPWNNQWIKIGEAAFTLDPLSSTGVEKAMRFSLQVAVAVNTYLKDPDSRHPKMYYEEKLIESAVSHARWTLDFYRQAWSFNQNSEFWKKKTDFKLHISINDSCFLNKLQEEFNKEQPIFENETMEPVPIDFVIQRLWDMKIIISPQVTYSIVYTINNDYIELKKAISHPNLKRPIVYLDHVELKPIFKAIDGNKISNIVGLLNLTMSIEKAKKMLVFLWYKQILIAN